MNWYIFAIVVLTGIAVIACISAYAWGQDTGRREGYQSGVSDTRGGFTEHERIAYNNGHTKGFQVGVDHQKRIVAERAREAAKHGKGGRYIKRGATKIEPL